MSNPLKKESHTGMTTALIIGAAVAGALAYLFLTEDGGELLSDLSGKIKESFKDAASGIVSEKTGVSKKTVKQVADHVVK